MIDDEDCTAFDIGGNLGGPCQCSTCRETFLPRRSEPKTILLAPPASSPDIYDRYQDVCERNRALEADLAQAREDVARMQLANDKALNERDQWQREAERIGNNYRREIERADAAEKERDQARAALARVTTLRHYDDWHEDIGNVLWWRFVPVCEPPYCGTPLDDDWPFPDDESPHWTPLAMPNNTALSTATGENGREG